MQPAWLEKEDYSPMDPDKKSNALWVGLFVVLAASLAVPFMFVHEPR